jgi:hypothetical protein
VSARIGKKVTYKSRVVKEDGAEAEGNDGDDEETVEFDPTQYGTLHASNIASCGR